MNWIIEEKQWNKDKIEFFGSKFSIGNGYMGYRGTLEEYQKEQLVSCTMAGLFDDSGNGWREPVNIPNGLFTRVYCEDECVSAVEKTPVKHVQTLDIRRGIHRRKSSFLTSKDTTVKIESERFLSSSNLHLVAMKYSISCDQDSFISMETGIDYDIWDINGPHLDVITIDQKEDMAYVQSQTKELKCLVSVGEYIIKAPCEEKIIQRNGKILRKISFQAKANQTYQIEKVMCVYKELDSTIEPLLQVEEDCKVAKQKGYEQLYKENEEEWNKKWGDSEVKIEGDKEAELALKYSMYLLLISAPFHTDRIAIPARGLSGQVYKGAMFWDTEMYMLPMFLYHFPQIARNLVMYRVHTLEGARKKAAEYGFKGAFYPWESQETGEDGCTHFNLNDIFTGRPMRTYFRDKQVHISADVAYGIWSYYLATQDDSILLEGGAEVILECARFFYSYAYFKKDKNRYEILDVTGADEYHERVNNNGYTNMMIKLNLESALEVLTILEQKYPEVYTSLVNRLNYQEEIAHIKEMNELLYIPPVGKENQVIEQYDGYFSQEDITLEELKSRMIHPNEYLGSPCGLSVNTQILKQADIVLMLNVFGERYNAEVKRANWLYYEPRTEHGSSLSTCVYALLAAQIGELEWAYKYFMKAATIDLIGNYKLYLGDLYIGGTHPAANGGSWMVAILGFGGIKAQTEKVSINPKLPKHWKSLSLPLYWKNQKLKIILTHNQISIHSDEKNTMECVFEVYSKKAICKIGENITLHY